MIGVSTWSSCSGTTGLCCGCRRHSRREGESPLAAAAAASGFVHSYLLYSLAFFDARRLRPQGDVSHAHAARRWAHRVGSNLCRVGGADPKRSRDPPAAPYEVRDRGGRRFLNFVFPRRYFDLLLAVATNVSDFVIHRPPTYTRGRTISALTAYTYNGIYAWLLYRTFGGAFAFVVMIVMLPHVGFYLDRVRQFTEHNLMPLENENGARSLGLGFWGMLLGGGPWGSPCHLEHHLAANLPWYGQLLLHRHLEAAVQRAIPGAPSDRMAHALVVDRSRAVLVPPARRPEAEPDVTRTRRGSR
jgi:hypothetical protein